MSARTKHHRASELWYRANRAQLALRSTIAIRSRLRAAPSRLRRHASPGVLGLIDLFDPSLRETWGGPLNGQERRREIVQELASAIEFDRVLETGTFRGSSTEFFATVFDCP